MVTFERHESTWHYQSADGRSWLIKYRYDTRVQGKMDLVDDKGKVMTSVVLTKAQLPFVRTIAENLEKVAEKCAGY